MRDQAKIKIKTVTKSFFTDNQESQDVLGDISWLKSKVKEPKRVATHVLLKPSTHLILQKLAKKKGTSKNEIINQLVDLFTKSV